MRPIVSWLDSGNGRYFNIGAVFVLLGVFSVPVLGASAHDILLGIAAALLLISPERRRMITVLRDNPVAVLGIVLFAWIAISAIWSTAEPSERFDHIVKYRNLFAVALLMPFFLDKSIRTAATWAIFAGLLVALFYSYGVAFEMLEPTREGRISIHGRIFNGISVAFFSYMNLVFMARRDKWMIFHALLYLACFYQLFVIEDGRTGYVAFLALTMVFLVQQLRLYSVLVGALAVALGALAVGYFPDALPLRIGSTSNELLFSYSSLEDLQRGEIRFEFYLFSFHVFLENWLLGVGAGGFQQTYLVYHSDHLHFYSSTANPHSEYLMIAVQTGLIGLVLFGLYLVSIAWGAWRIPDRTQRDLAGGLFGLIVIACLFNSSFFDHYDGMFFMVLIAILLATSRDTAGEGAALPAGHQGDRISADQ